jgi:DNA-binding NarL/FixJ family response regulator
MTWTNTFNGEPKQNEQIKVVLADDHAVVRVGLRRLFSRTSDICVVGETDNGTDAIAAVNRWHPDILLLDMEMPGLTGLEVTTRLQTERSPVRILILSGYEDSQFIRMILSAGASGYLTKGENPEMLLRAIREIAGGNKSWVKPKETGRLGQRVESFPS